MLAIPVGLPGQKVGWRRAESITEGPNGTSNTETSTHINSVLMYSYAVYVINLHIYAAVVAVKSLSRVLLFATPRTVARQPPLYMEFSRQQCWRGCHFLLQGIFLTRRLKPGFLHCRQILYDLSHRESP